MQHPRPSSLPAGPAAAVTSSAGAAAGGRAKRPVGTCSTASPPVWRRRLAWMGELPPVGDDPEGNRRIGLVTVTIQLYSPGRRQTSDSGTVRELVDAAPGGIRPLPCCRRGQVAVGV